MVALQRSTDARIGQGRELDRTLACVRGGGEELRIRFSRMAHELGHAVFEASDDGKEIRDLDVAGVLELADEVIGGAHALGTVLVALEKRMRPGRSTGLDRELAHRPRQRRVVVDPVMRIDMTRNVPDELAGTGKLRSVLNERLIAVEVAREELRGPSEGTVGTHQGGNPGGIGQWARVGQHEMHPDIERRRRARERGRHFGAWRVGDERGARDDPLAVGANDAAGDTRGSTEVVRVHDQPLHELRGSVAPRPGAPPPAPEDPPAGVASMTARTSHPDDSRRRRASSSSTPVSSRTMRIARSRSLLLAGRMSIMRSPLVRPSFTIAAVESMFSASFVAVPALSRLEPARISGPTRRTMGTSASWASGDAGSQVIPTVRAPRSLHAASAAST